MRAELGQLSLADGLVDGGAGWNRQLEKIAALVEWTVFEQLLGRSKCPFLGSEGTNSAIIQSSRRILDCIPNIIV
jgi:hypothetical protein